MRLFTRGDLERAARLALLRQVQEPEGDPETAIAHAVLTVTEETPQYLSRDQALEAAHLVAQGVEPLKAVKAVLDERNSGKLGD
jgi:hypothetical protein